jgi:hypothetical protein
MKTFRRLAAVPHTYILWKPGVKRKREFFRRYSRFRIEMRYLSLRVHSAVRSSRSEESHGAARYTSKLLLYQLLHGYAVRLDLPADIIRAVVFDYHPYAFHSGFT